MHSSEVTLYKLGLTHAKLYATPRMSQGHVHWCGTAPQTAC